MRGVSRIRLNEEVWKRFPEFQKKLRFNIKFKKSFFFDFFENVSEDSMSENGKSIQGEDACGLDNQQKASSFCLDLFEKKHMFWISRFLNSCKSLTLSHLDMEQSMKTNSFVFVLDELEINTKITFQILFFRQSKTKLISQFTRDLFTFINTTFKLKKISICIEPDKQTSAHEIKAEIIPPSLEFWNNIDKLKSFNLKIQGYSRLAQKNVDYVFCFQVQDIRNFKETKKYFSNEASFFHCLIFLEDQENLFVEEARIYEIQKDFAKAFEILELKNSLFNHEDFY